MNKLFFLTSILFFSFKAFSQNTRDSLISRILSATSDDARIAFIFQLSGINKNEVSHSGRKSIEKTILKWYREEPNAGLRSVAMVRRGGFFSYGKDVMRSAQKGALNYFPNQRRGNVGFRIAKTL